MQFQRFLNGESFPKPNLLKVICDFFEVDARVLLEPLDEAMLQSMRHSRSAATLMEVNIGLAEVYSQFDINPDIFSASEDFPDGHYNFWRNSMSRAGMIFCTVIQVKTLNNCRMVRSFDPRMMYPDLSGAALRRWREFKGVLFRQQTGYSIILHHQSPSWALSHVYLYPVPVSVGGVMLYGFTTFGREEFPGMSRMSRVVWQRVGPSCGDRRAASRAAGWFAPEDVPSQILSMLQAPLG
ncbi:MAG: hypothetical protein ORN49_03485 [Rhodobacteraceae bacterium]|nr:hypothetical protein [Paracoccaceae bacterium]